MINIITQSCGTTDGNKFTKAQHTLTILSIVAAPSFLSAITVIGKHFVVLYISVLVHL